MTSSRGNRGFTLIEMLVAISLLVLLMSISIYGIRAYQKIAGERGSKGLIDQVRSALDDYYKEFRRYPPDGFDPTDPAFADIDGSRVPIRGTTCLVFYLGTERTKEIEVGARTKKVRVGPFLELRKSMLSGTGDLDERLADSTVELIDAFGSPIHYDNVERDKNGDMQVADQSAVSVHTTDDLIDEEQHGPDPRVQGGTIVAKNAGSYDLWSHGASMADTTDDVKNWE